VVVNALFAWRRSCQPSSAWNEGCRSWTFAAVITARWPGGNKELERDAADWLDRTVSKVSMARILALRTIAWLDFLSVPIVGVLPP
jgi:hypothetical protein